MHYNVPSKFEVNIRRVGQDGEVISKKYEIFGRSGYKLNIEEPDDVNNNYQPESRHESSLERR